MPGATFPDLSVFDAVRVRARRRRSPRVGGDGWGRWSALVVVAAVLAGCTAQAEEPAPPPATTSSAEPSVEPTTEPDPEPEPEPTGLVRPEAMDRNDDAGAIAAAEYYTLLAYEALRTSETAEWSTVGADTCDFCTDLIAEVQSGIDEGATFEGGEVRLQGPGRIVGREESMGVIGVDVPVQVSEQVKYDAEGAVEKTWPTSDHFLYLELAHGYEGWVVMTAHSHAASY